MNQRQIFNISFSFSFILFFSLVRIQTAVGTDHPPLQFSNSPLRFVLHEVEEYHPIYFIYNDKKYICETDSCTEAMEELVKDMCGY